ncbi:MAG: hypothetical protein RLZZ328_1011 [Bacteroidota bacterium]|jgi:hypothetical protein
MGPLEKITRQKTKGPLYFLRGLLFTQYRNQWVRLEELLLLLEV